LKPADHLVGCTLISTAAVRWLDRGVDLGVHLVPDVVEVACVLVYAPTRRIVDT
jgi:hypothetical protein